MKIGDIAKATGLKIETIRFYESEGLIAPPMRNGSNYRLYSQSHLERLSFVKRSRDLGFTMDEVRELMRLADDPTGSCEEVDAITQRHVAGIDRKLADLQALRAGLMSHLDCCSKTTISNCQIIGALSPETRGDQTRS
jgi:Cu(I)-responsive transcriptional regulator